MQARTDAAALLAKYRVDYVVIGPQEHSVVKPNVAFFESLSGNRKHW